MIAISRRRGLSFDPLRIYIAVLREARAALGLCTKSRVRLMSRIRSWCSGSRSSLPRYLKRAIGLSPIASRSARQGAPAQQPALSGDQRLIGEKPEHAEDDDAGVELGAAEAALRHQDVEAQAALRRLHLRHHREDERDREADAHAG